MFYGFAPIAAPVPPPATAVPVIIVYAFKNTGLTDNAIASAGALSLWNVVYNNKANDLVQFQGDFPYGPILYGQVIDSDWVDAPYHNIGAFQ